MSDLQLQAKVSLRHLDGSVASAVAEKLRARGLEIVGISPSGVYVRGDALTFARAFGRAVRVEEGRGEFDGAPDLGDVSDQAESVYFPGRPLHFP